MPTLRRRSSQHRLRASLLIALGVGIVVAHQVRQFVSPLLAAPSPDIVISQVYGGGGNSGAPFTHDYIELFNRGTAPVSLDGWSLQYASATGTGNFGANTGQITELPAVVLDPGQYFLVQEAGGTTGAPLPTPDHVDPTPIAMAAGAGKVALVNTTAPLGCNGGSTPCSAEALARIVDLVGYGNANFFEGAGAAPTLSNTAAALRIDLGCTDTDNNATDFGSGTPAPRNTASPLNPCTGPPALSIDDVSVTEGDSGSVTAVFTVRLSSPAGPGGVTFDIATADGTATTADGDYLAVSLSAEVIPQNENSYEFAVTVLGDTNIEPNETFVVDVTNVTGATLADGQGVGIILNDDFATPVFDVVISQVYGGGGNAGATLRNDFIELFNRGTAPVNLTSWSVQYNSAGGSGTWFVTPLSGTIAPGGYYLVQQAAGAGGTADLPHPDATGTIAMAATAGKVALRSDAAALAGSCPAGSTLIDLVGYGPTASCFEGAGPAAAPANTTAVLRKRGGCFDSNNNSTDFSTATPLPRNSAASARSCEYTPAAIHQIQGSGPATPFLGRDVSTTGVVTARKANGFFLQTPDAATDADPATSQGIFVFTSTAPSASVGDFVTVKGTAMEFFNLTQIESTLAGDVTVESGANPLPAPVVVTTQILHPAGSPDQLERLEGMRVHAGALVSVAPTNGFGEITTVLPGVARPIREPGIPVSLPVPPDPTSGVPDCCIPRFDENPERIMVDTDGLAGSAALTVTSHVTLSDVTGPLDFTFGAYKILPELPPATSANASAVPVPPPAAGEFTVAGFNIENFGNSPVQRQKAALAIRDVLQYPDIIGHAEIRDLASLQALALQVNEDAVAAGGANPAYEAHLIPASPTATQNVGFLVKTSRVRVDAVTQERASETFINPNTGQPDILHDRPPLVLRATIDPEGPDPRAVIAIVNHTRSFIDIELVAGEGPRVRAKRTAQAESLAGLLQELQAANPSTPIISVGDYNAYEFNDGYTDPIAVIKGTPTPDDQIVVDASPDLVDPDFINLTDGLPRAERYSFIFEGNPQALDHVLVNTVAHSFLRRYAIGRMNADFPVAFSADPTRAERNSDHDAPVAYFKFPPRPTTTTVPAVAATYNAAGQSVLLTAGIGVEGKAVSEGSVDFIVTTAGGTVVATASAGVSEGGAAASVALPPAVLPQALKISAAFSGGPTTLPSTGSAALALSYAVCTLYDARRAVMSGGVYPIRLRLCDASGVNVSSPDVSVVALHVSRASALDTTATMESAGKANPDNRFRYDAEIGGYVFNLDTSGLAPGVYNLQIGAGADPATHVVEFRVR